jgi:hypothetical protein
MGISPRLERRVFILEKESPWLREKKNAEVGYTASRPGSIKDTRADLTNKEY